MCLARTTGPSLRGCWSPFSARPTRRRSPATAEHGLLCPGRAQGLRRRTLGRAQTSNRPDKPAGVTMSTASAEQAPRLSGSWLHALALLDEDLRRTNAAPRTRRAYAVDTLQFACWADARRRWRPRLSVRATSAAIWRSLTERELSATTTARKLAAIRALFRSQREHGHIEQSPADLLATPRRGSSLAACVEGAGGCALARLHPRERRGRATGAARPCAVRAGLRVRSARRGDRYARRRRRRS